MKTLGQLILATNNLIPAIVVILFCLNSLPPLLAHRNNSLFLIYGRDPVVIAQFKKYGYLGAFLVSLIGNASAFLFMGTVLPVLAGIGAMLYPASGLLEWAWGWLRVPMLLLAR